MVVDARVRWAVIGCGWVATDYVIPAIVAARNGTLAALCDRNPAALRDVAVPTFSSLDDLLRFAQFDAVYIATPNASHADVTVACARAGKHVLCEKPMATTIDDAQRMVAACEAVGVRFATAYDQPHHPAHIALRDRIKRDELGIVTQARIHYACWLPPAWCTDNWRVDPALAGGGAMFDLAPHGIDLLEAILGDPWRDLIALTQQRVHRYAVDDGAVLAGRFASGTLGVIQVAYNCPEAYPRRTLEVIGTQARALAVDTMGQTPGGTLTLTLAESGETVDVPFDTHRSPFLGTVEAFADSVLTDHLDTASAMRDLRLFTLMEAATCR